MPLCFINTPDKIMWKLSQDGAFSLRSSNFCIMENFLDNNHLCESGNWVAIWNLNILAKLKDFIWRITIIYKGCCTHIQQVWMEASLWHILQHAFDTPEDMRNFIFFIPEKFNNSQVEHIVTVLCFSAASIKNGTHTTNGQIYFHRNSTWSKPPTKFMKCNMDFGVAACIRDDEGIFAAGCCCCNFLVPRSANSTRG
ncbi:hypothetical protein GLYMA_14G002200v4 [Glycine max]|uniref:Reverse transcriptase zinc-binding domain-containing protein n=1 Tax=Glycine max TaxID=3847 RepID=A0A0R0GGS6_SOYBN|nr:hypothetical protein GLYMA_14G002200v4 [Glycine max]